MIRDSQGIVSDFYWKTLQTGGKGNLNPVTKNSAIKAYEWSGNKNSYNLSITGKRVTDFSLRLPCILKETTVAHWRGNWLGPKAGGSVNKEKNNILLGLEHRSSSPWVVYFSYELSQLTTDGKVMSKRPSEKRL
jgi:hypothetical protein